MEVMKKRNIAS